MASRVKTRQRLDKVSQFDAFSNEDADEQELEDRLFGSRNHRKRTRRSSPDIDDDSALGWMQDHELFTVDVPVASAIDVSEDEADERPSIEFVDTPVDYTAGRAASTSSVILWHDPADDAILPTTRGEKRLKKLSRGVTAPTNTSGTELQSKLRKQFERLHPKPEWAHRRVEAGVPTLQRLLNSTESFLSPTPSKSLSPLPANSIDIQRLPNANVPLEGSSSGVVDLKWHPSTRVPVLATAGLDRRIDGHTNAPLLTLHIPSLPLAKISFHPSGSSLLITGTRPHYYTYDLASQTITRSPRTVFGSAPTPSSPQSVGRHEFSPDGSLLAVAGRRGCVSILEWSNAGGTGAVVSELKSGRGGAVEGLSWNEDGSELSVLGGRDGSEVEVWNVAERNIVRRWKDVGAYGGQVLRQFKSDYTAIGSSTGIVNLYQSSTISNCKADEVENVQPFKSLEHLTTPLSVMDFHPSGQILATASATKQKQLKLYHLPTATAFANWPTNATPLGRVNTLGFSASGEYMAAGNTKGGVLVWSLKHFVNAPSV